MRPEQAQNLREVGRKLLPAALIQIDAGTNLVDGPERC
jgi:hypothetical protein